MLILSLKSPLGKVNKVCMYVCMIGSLKSSETREEKGSQTHVAFLRESCPSPSAGSAVENEIV